MLTARTPNPLGSPNTEPGSLTIVLIAPKLLPGIRSGQILGRLAQIGAGADADSADAEPAWVTEHRAGFVDDCAHRAEAAAGNPIWTDPGTPCSDRGRCGC